MYNGPRAIEIIQGDSIINGLHINFQKCQLLSKQDLSMFHPEILRCSIPDFETLGAPIGSPDFCTTFIEKKLKEANHLLSLLPKLRDPQSAVALLRSCAFFFRLVHLARSIPSTTRSLEAFARFDDDVLHCLECLLEIELTPQAYNHAGPTWSQVWRVRLALPEQPCPHSLHCLLMYLTNTSPPISTNYAMPLWCHQGIQWDGTGLWAALNRKCKKYFPSSSQTIVSHWEC